MSRMQLVLLNEDNSKKTAPGSFWSEKDEISLLKGMIDYEVMTQSSPYADMGKFFNFIKPSIHFDVQRKQLTDRIWKLKNRFIKSGFNTSKPHHALLLELAKSVKSWEEQYADMHGGGGGGGESENVGLKDGVDFDELFRVVDSIGKGKVGISDVPEGKKDLVQVDKSLKMVKNKDRVGQDGENDNVAIDADVHANKGKGLELVKKKKKRKRKYVNGDGQNVKEVDVILDDVNCTKSSKLVENKKKGKVVSCDAQTDKGDAVVVEDVHANKGKGLELVKKKKKSEFVNGDGQNVKEVDMILDDVNCRKSSKLFENKKKGKVVACDAQTDKVDAVVVEDVVAHDDQNVGQDIVVADAVLANKKESGGVNKKDLKSMYPESTKVLELETLSRMPQQIKNNSVMDIINFMGREKAKEFEGKFADLRIMELELHAKKLDLAHKQINLVLEAVRR